MDHSLHGAPQGATHEVHSVASLSRCPWADLQNAAHRPLGVGLSPRCGSVPARAVAPKRSRGRARGTGTPFHGLYYCSDHGTGVRAQEPQLRPQRCASGLSRGDKVSLCDEAVHYGSRPPWQKDWGRGFCQRLSCLMGGSRRGHKYLGPWPSPSCQAGSLQACLFGAGSSI